MYRNRNRIVSVSQPYDILKAIRLSYDTVTARVLFEYDRSTLRYATVTKPKFLLYQELQFVSLLGFFSCQARQLPVLEPKCDGNLRDGMLN